MLGGYHLKRGGMPLHDAVTEAQKSSIWAKVCMLMIGCVLSDFT